MPGMIGIEDEEGGSKIGRLGGWEDSAAIAEMNGAKKEALLTGSSTRARSEGFRMG